MQHKEGISFETYVLSNVTTVKLLIALLWIVPQNIVTIAINRVITSPFVPFALKGSVALHIMPPLVSIAPLHCSLPHQLFLSCFGCPSKLDSVTTALANPTSVIPKMVQQMIYSAFYAYSLSSIHTVSSRLWLFLLRSL